MNLKRHTLTLSIRGIKFPEAAENTELVNTISLFLGKYRISFLQFSGHRIPVDQSIHNLILCVFLSKTP